MKTKVEKLIFDAIEEMNTDIENKIPLDKGNNTPLFGKKGVLDSLGLVNLVVSVEAAIEDEFGVTVTIADERAMSQKNSPFKTIGTLADYICLLLEGQTNE